MTDRYDLSRFGLSYAGADPSDIDRLNSQMDTNPVRIVREDRPKQQDRSSIWALKVDKFRPGMVVTEDAHIDLTRELSPEGKQARLDELLRIQSGE